MSSPEDQSKPPAGAPDVEDAPDPDQLANEGLAKLAEAKRRACLVGSGRRKCTRITLAHDVARRILGPEEENEREDALTETERPRTAKPLSCPAPVKSRAAKDDEE